MTKRTRLAIVAFSAIICACLIAILLRNNGLKATVIALVLLFLGLLLTNAIRKTKPS
ncbi:MAG TPA: hypothetical protein VKR56_11400 [Candidatus Cybelea sp.]|nr:hypothetical protein [Candidatus Cybelea sp.]